MPFGQGDASHWERERLRRESGLRGLPPPNPRRALIFPFSSSTSHILSQDCPSCKITNPLVPEPRVAGRREEGGESHERGFGEPLVVTSSRLRSEVTETERSGDLCRVTQPFGVKDCFPKSGAGRHHAMPLCSFVLLPKAGGWAGVRNRPRWS